MPVKEKGSENNVLSDINKVLPAAPLHCGKLVHQVYRFRLSSQAAGAELWGRNWGGVWSFQDPASILSL